MTSSTSYYHGKNLRVRVVLAGDENFDNVVVFLSNEAVSIDGVGRNLSIAVLQVIVESHQCGPDDAVKEEC